MSDEESTDVFQWVRGRTTVDWGMSFPTHCLSPDYQVLEPRGWPFEGAPRFRQNSFRREIMGPLGKLDSEEKIELQTETLNHAERVIELTLDARENYRGLIEQGGEGATHVQREIERLCAEAEDLASLIDRKFEVVRVRSHSEVQKLRKDLEQNPLLASNTDTSKHFETNILDETRRLLLFLDRVSKDGSERDLRRVTGNKADIEEKIWHIRHEDSPSARLISSRPQREGFELLDPLSKPMMRPCVDLSSLGFEVGLDRFPADATIEQALTYFWHYAKDAYEAADEYGNSHALLCLRLLVAREISNEHKLYGSVEKRSRKEVEERWTERDHSRKKVGEPQKLFAALEKLLANPDLVEDAWRNEGGSYIPNGSGLHNLLMKRNKEVLRRDDAHQGTYVSVRTVRNYLDEIGGSEIKKLRSEAGLDSEKT